ncbi:MAG: recombinase family protein [Clostridia bacterium]
MQKVTSYYRVSKKSINQLNSLEKQKEYINKYLSNSNVEVCKDEHISAFDRMMMDSKYGKFDTIYIR